MTDVDQSNKDTDDQPKPRTVPSPKRGAIPTPKEEIEKAKPYVPKTDQDDNNPAADSGSSESVDDG